MSEDLNLRLGYQVDVTQMAITGCKEPIKVGIATEQDSNIDTFRVDRLRALQNIVDKNRGDFMEINHRLRESEAIRMRQMLEREEFEDDYVEFQLQRMKRRSAIENRNESKRAKRARAKARKRGELVVTDVGPEEPPRKEIKLLESEKPTTILIKDEDDD